MFLVCAIQCAPQLQHEWWITQKHECLHLNNITWPSSSYVPCSWNEDLNHLHLLQFGFFVVAVCSSVKSTSPTQLPQITWIRAISKNVSKSRWVNRVHIFLINRLDRTAITPRREGYPGATWPKPSRVPLRSFKNNLWNSHGHLGRRGLSWESMHLGKRASRCLGSGLGKLGREVL